MRIGRALAASPTPTTSVCTCRYPRTSPASAIAKAVAAGRSIDVTHPFPLTINRSIVNGSQRIELVGFPADRLAWLKAAGCFTEVIQYRTRVFVPVALAEAILETVLEATT